MILVKPSHEILTPVDGDQILKGIEVAGRTCYKSEDKITADSARAFVARIVKSGHDSVIEHASISVRFVCDRGVSHEIVRHRLAAYSQESTRYCDYKGGVTFVIPSWMNAIIVEHETKAGQYPFGISTLPEQEWYDSMVNAEASYLFLLRKGWSPQQARSVLPNSLKTEIVMTANIREWRHVLKLRTSAAAHPQMRELMIPLLTEFKAQIPVLFDDIEVKS